MQSLPMRLKSRPRAAAEEEEMVWGPPRRRHPPTGRARHGTRVTRQCPTPPSRASASARDEGVPRSEQFGVGKT